MNYQAIEQELNVLAKTPGIIACALVAIDTGMVYLQTYTDQPLDHIAEGSRDYWVLHTKNGNVFDTLGPITSIAVSHRLGLISIRPCGETMLLICISQHKTVDWKRWPEQVNQLYTLIKEQEASQSAAFDSTK